MLTNTHLQSAYRTSAGSRSRSKYRNTIKTAISKTYRLKSLCPVVVASRGTALRRTAAGDVGIIRFLSGSHLVGCWGLGEGEAAPVNRKEVEEQNRLSLSRRIQRTMALVL